MRNQRTAGKIKRTAGLFAGTSETHDASPARCRLPHSSRSVRRSLAPTPCPLSRTVPVVPRCRWTPLLHLLRRARAAHLLGPAVTAPRRPSHRPAGRYSVSRARARPRDGAPRCRDADPRNATLATTQPLLSRARLPTPASLERLGRRLARTLPATLGRARATTTAFAPVVMVTGLTGSTLRAVVDRSDAACRAGRPHFFCECRWTGTLWLDAASILPGLIDCLLWNASRVGRGGTNLPRQRRKRHHDGLGRSVVRRVRPGQRLLRRAGGPRTQPGLPKRHNLLDGAL